MSRTHTPTLILGLLALAAGASGQTADDPNADGGPVVVGTSRESWKGFELLRFDSALEFRVESVNDKLRQSGQPTLSTRETRYRELVDLSGEAIIGHRNLLDITGAVQFGIEDIYGSSTTGDLNGHEHNVVSLYDVSALLMGSSLLPTTIYARREENLMNRPFSGTINQTLMEEGVTARLESATAPTTVHYFHREDQQEGDFGNVDSNVKQDSLSVQNGLLLSPSHRIDTGYTFDHIDERQGDSYADVYDRNDLNIVDTYTFGGELKPHELRSALHYYDQTGLQAQNRLRADENLTLRHSDRLETRYNASLDSREVQGQTQQLARGEASVKHRLYESLVSVGTIGAARLEAPDSFTSDNWYLSGQFDYTKLAPLGRIDASAGGSFVSQTDSDRGSTFRITDELYTFVDGFPIILSHSGIIAGSVVITPLAGFPVYQEGVDYTLTINPDFAEVRGIVGGAFVNGQRLSISYDVGPEPGSSIDTTIVNFSVRYTLTEGRLRGLAFYAAYRNVGNALRASDPSLFQLDDLDDILLGVEYRRGGLELLYEYNNHDSEFDPYIVHRAQALYNRSLGLASALNLAWTREIIDFTEQNDHVVFDRGSLQVTKRIDQYLDLNASLEYRNEDSSVDGDSEGFEQVIGLRWHRRQTSIYASFRNAFLDGPGSNQTAQTLEFGFHRTF